MMKRSSFVNELRTAEDMEYASRRKIEIGSLDVIKLRDPDPQSNRTKGSGFWKGLLNMICPSKRREQKRIQKQQEEKNALHEVQMLKLEIERDLYELKKQVDKNEKERKQKNQRLQKKERKVKKLEETKQQLQLGMLREMDRMHKEEAQAQKRNNLRHIVQEFLTVKRRPGKNMAWNKIDDFTTANHNLTQGSSRIQDSNQVNQWFKEKLSRGGAVFDTAQLYNESGTESLRKMYHHQKAETLRTKEQEEQLRGELEEMKETMKQTEKVHRLEMQVETERAKWTLLQKMKKEQELERMKEEEKEEALRRELEKLRKRIEEAEELRQIDQLLYAEEVKREQLRKRMAKEKKTLKQQAEREAERVKELHEEEMEKEAEVEDEKPTLASLQDEMEKESEVEDEMSTLATLHEKMEPEAKRQDETPTLATLQVEDETLTPETLHVKVETEAKRPNEMPTLTIPQKAMEKVETENSIKEYESKEEQIQEKAAKVKELEVKTNNQSDEQLDAMRNEWRTWGLQKETESNEEKEEDLFKMFGKKQTQTQNQKENRTEPLVARKRERTQKVPEIRNSIKANERKKDPMQEKAAKVEAKDTSVMKEMDLFDMFVKKNDKKQTQAQDEMKNLTEQLALRRRERTHKVLDETLVEKTEKRLTKPSNIQHRAGRQREKTERKHLDDDLILMFGAK
ncbi:trichohyalin-like [Trichomycterus rosablanca]|uniref:trichohyalin-like n=1 Tax=Trichomycterus rosablanca TaxID=2290929 RepID=UPI002F3510ED